MPVDVADLQSRLARAYAGELEITGVLGVGGFAAVFRAHDPVLQRDVAIKVIDVAGRDDVDNRERFLHEARIVATVEHPHIVPLYSVEMRDRLLCLSMRLVPGRSLAERIHDAGTLAPVEAARIAHQVAEALATAHAHGVVHRDIKPENILIDAGGNAIVTDFGISLVTGRDSDRRPGMAIGTPTYISPEQALGEDIDGRADVYSLGIVLYEMLTGRPPFAARTTSGLLAKQIIEIPPPIASLQPDTPTALVRATEHALAKSPNQRISASEFAGELAAAQLPAALLTPRAVRRKRRWRRIRWTVAITLVVAAALAMVIWSVYQTYTTFSGGAIPELSAAGSDAPAGLIAASLADGSMHPGEKLDYVFIPHGAGWSNALLMTDSAIIRRTPHGPRRFDAWGHGATLQFQFARSGNRRTATVGGTGINGKDTLYTDLSGAETGILLSAFVSVAKTHDTH